MFEKVCINVRVLGFILSQMDSEKTEFSIIERETIDGVNHYKGLLDNGTARFKNLTDSQMFAEMKSKNSRPYEMFSVTKNLSGDSLGSYYVYLVYDKRF